MHSATTNDRNILTLEFIALAAQAVQNIQPSNTYEGIQSAPSNTDHSEYGAQMEESFDSTTMTPNECRHRSNANRHRPVVNEIQSPTQHENIPNSIDYATQSNYQEHIHIGNPLPEENPEHIFQLLCVNPNGISVTQHKNKFAEICHTVACFLVDDMPHQTQPGYITSYCSSTNIPNSKEHIQSHQTHFPNVIILL